MSFQARAMAILCGMASLIAAAEAAWPIIPGRGALPMHHPHRFRRGFYGTNTARETADRVRVGRAMCAASFDRVRNNETLTGISTDGRVLDHLEPFKTFCDDPAGAEQALMGGGSRDASSSARNSSMLLCVVVRNQANVVNEFIAHHRLLGVDFVAFYDDRSTDNLAAVLQPWVRLGVAALHKTTPRVEGGQTAAYQHCFDEYAVPRSFRWVSWIDADEQWLPMKGSRCLPQALQEYESHAGVSVPYSLYEEPMLMQRTAATTKRTSLELVDFGDGKSQALVKSICNVAKSVGPPNAMPHCCLPKAGETVVDENKRVMAGDPCWSLPHHANLSQKLRLNHFQRLFVEDSVLKQERDFEWNGFYGVDADNYVDNCLRLVRASAGSGDPQRQVANRALLHPFIMDELVPGIKSALSIC